MQKTIPIIIVTYNQIESFTIPCIKSIIANTVQPYQIVVVDNASQDNTPNILRSKFGAIDIVSSRINLGWDGGNLLGIEHIDKNYNFDYFCLLNSDTLVSKNWLSKLQTILEKNISAATVIPTEGIVRRNIFKEMYINNISRFDAITRLLLMSPLKMLMGRGLTLPRSIKPQIGKSTGKNIYEVDKLNAKLEYRYKDTVDKITYVRSGYCLLARKTIKEDIVTYLHDFDTLFPLKSVEYWNRISESKNIEHLVSKGTFVYHYRGGSGGYGTS